VFGQTFCFSAAIAAVALCHKTVSRFSGSLSNETQNQNHERGFGYLMGSDKCLQKSKNVVM
jgi:hypothetical protein